MPDDAFRPAAALDANQDTIRSQLERSTPVRLMATLGRFVSADISEPLAEAIDRADHHRFDYLPVRKGADGPVVGLFARKGPASMDVDWPLRNPCDPGGIAAPAS